MRRTSEIKTLKGEEAPEVANNQKAQDKWVRLKNGYSDSHIIINQQILGTIF